MKRKIKSQLLGISLKVWLRWMIYFLVLVAFVVLSVSLHGIKTSLADQTAAMRWDEKGDCSQVTAFFNADAGVNGESIPEWRYNIDKQLKDKSVVNENENARLFIDAYAANGNVNMVSSHGDVNVDVLGVGGDFFMFHPLKIVNGGYFSESDLMQDSIIIDEETAWNLFGSSDIVGKTVLIGDSEQRIVGVYKHEDSKLFKKAGGGGNLCYVSYTTLCNSGSASPISVYEAIMPNIVKGFALQIVKDSCKVDEKSVAYLDNSARFSYEALYDILLHRQERVMKMNTLVFPPYENVARVVEERAADVALWQCICLLVFIVAVVVEFILFYRKHRITKKKIVDLWDKITEKLRQWKSNRKKKKAEGENNEEI